VQTLISLVAIVPLVLYGCAKDDEMRFRRGKGDVGTFILQHALTRGARQVDTNNLPSVAAEWRYREDRYGVVFRLPCERFAEIQALLRRVFGPPASEATETTNGGRLGWYARKDIGVALQFGYDRKYTQVIVLGPQPTSGIPKRVQRQSKTSVQRAIARAESILPGRPAPDGVSDPRWQAIIRVGAFIESEPEAVWEFTLRWGKHVQSDLRTAVATCLLEHLLEYHFESIFPRVRQAALSSVRFADTFERCWWFGQAEDPKYARRIKRLQGELRRRHSE
jgi:hypothetical protein